ncbi:MAG TPA: hypothetical protein VMP41_05190 [Acidimicrobiales bacterium]|nr:hypothetical protein [Acidimicrobiales bacterium]
MTLFYMTIPLMVLAILVAAVPLVVVSRREVTDLVRDAEKRFERHQRDHPGRQRITRRAARRSLADRPQSQNPRQRPWHQPVLLQKR